jgi:CheY-like chemotaxis protein
MMETRKKIGELLIEDGVITPKTLERALEQGRKEHKKVGLILEEMGVASGEEIADVLARQFGYRRVANISGHSFAKELLELVTVNTAMRYLLFPLRQEENRLFLAVADPTETTIISNISQNNNLVVIPLIATRADIMAAISKHYLGKAALVDKNKSVLVVDDNPLVISEIKQILTREGYRVESAKDGIEAFKMAIADIPQVIVTDKEMPGLSGYRLIDALKSLPETGNIPVILHTASLDCEEEADAYRKGFFDFMAKPVKEVTLITRVKRAVDTFERIGRQG